MTKAKGSLLLFGVFGAVVAFSRCESVPLTAPGGSTIYLQANPPFVPANGGRSVVTALVVEPAGTLVPDGTELLFLTNLGTIEETAKTVDGIARAYFVSDARSGTATVTAMSGGDAATPTTTTMVSSVAPLTASSRSAGGVGSAVGTGTTEGRSVAAAVQATVTIEVGAVRPTRVTVGADPQRIISPGHATIVANVYDEHGNPAQNVPVIFKIDSVTSGGAAADLEEGLSSGGAPRYTDSTGQAFDTLYTTASPGVQKQVVVSATTSNGVVGTVTVGID